MKGAPEVTADGATKARVACGVEQPNVRDIRTGIPVKDKQRETGSSRRGRTPARTTTTVEVLCLFRAMVARFAQTHVEPELWSANIDAIVVERRLG